MDHIPAWAQEIRERLVRIETLLEPYNTIRDTAYKAKTLAEDNSKELADIKADLKEIHDDRKWLWRTIAGAIVVGCISIALNFVFRQF